jgi:hypothetical protein
MIWGTHILDAISNTIYGIYDRPGEVGAQVDTFYEVLTWVALW